MMFVSLLFDFIWFDLFRGIFYNLYLVEVMYEN